jgi:PAS domain S-box-containing protein
MTTQPTTIDSSASFRALIEASPDGIVVHHQGRIVYANAAIARMLGWESAAAMIGHPVIEAVHPDERASTIDRITRLNTGEPMVPFVEVRLLRRDGGVVQTSVGGLRVTFEHLPCVVAVCRDITEQRRLQSRLVEADRLVALGTLSAGLAHEINNPLTYLLLHVDAAAAIVQKLKPLVSGEALGLLDRLASSVGIAQDGASRVRDIVRGLRVFARTSDDERSPIAVRPALERAIAMTAHELRTRATVHAELGESPTVMASDGRLTQVFVNLLINAAHALPDGDPQAHEVRVRLWTEEAEVRVSVRDTGHGISPEHLAHLFDPFFTTKPVGEGSGLGLAIVHGIVTSLGGRVTVESQVGAGTTFVVALPAC